jgi:hypothetical protein
VSEYTVINILDMLESIGEDELSGILSDFLCPQNEEIEKFIHNNAIEFAKKKISITHLVFDDAAQLVAYFTLTHKTSNVGKGLLSKTSQKKLAMHARIDETIEAYSVSAYLIAQFGKNYGVNGGETITGNELMDLTFDVLERVQHQIGGGVIFLECEDNPVLLEFYQNNHNRFRMFGERYSDADHIKYLKLLRFF